MRILGLDFGDKTLGVAVSDALGVTAGGITVIRRNNPVDVKETLQLLSEIINSYQVEKIVLGLPKNMNNSIGPRGEKTLWFQKRLEKEFGLPVILWDERLSTVSADRALIEADFSRKKRKQMIDQTAAVFILQNYLDAQAALHKG